MNMYTKAGPIAVGHPGIHYLECLEMISTALSPRSYLEIGTNTGSSLQRFACDAAVCVDPAFQVNAEVFRNKERLFFFQMTSDRVFAEVDLQAVLRDGVDVAFLDGMHKFEYLLRDFINVERLCHEKSFILMHDCLPTTADIAEREPADEWSAWAGDVWKLLPILRKYRPDVRVMVLDCPPTGLVACSQLDPRSEALSSAYQEITEDFWPEILNETKIEALWQMYPVVDTRLLNQSPHVIKELF